MIKRLGVILAVSMLLSGCSLNLGQSEDIGTAGEFLKGKVASGFPAVPAYPKSNILESYGFDNNWGVSSISSDTLDKVMKFYNESLAIAGWDYTVRQVNETNFVFDIKNAKNQGSVIVNTAADGKKTAITVSVEPR
ncbi:hypothetical protein A3B51_01085 [Candidatus Curtissbacteria bacterium RIFCSPLOWO2_01_FULL_41_18]|uniref:Lipoprotein n=1 Tax=Candidatus Curtissbacteria bacterium RIFCSPLOWO2_01_FULL_41_18 TaxID=1797727 RepID=A0A1F5HHI3_9BACT|nr:MAG: hypothetical protein A3B51_01085 [Candidatus Curtissbacteria bacterium RIFCSPLOWO2_01_FULL_41_18]